MAIIPWLDGLRHKREERVKEFKNVQIQIFNLSSEIAGRENSTETQQFDEKDLTLKKLEELKLQLQELQNDKVGNYKLFIEVFIFYINFFFL